MEWKWRTQFVSMDSFLVMVAMCSHNIWPVQASTSDLTKKVCLEVLPTAMDFASTKSPNEQCVDISGRC